jgi:hypothetical protein
MRGYELYASPLIYSGQTVRAIISADNENANPVTAQLYVHVYGPESDLKTLEGPAKAIAPGEISEFTWKIPDTKYLPIVKIGVRLSSTQSPGTVYLDWLTWDGSPDVTFACPVELRGWSSQRPMWVRAWVNGVDQFDPWRSQAFDLIQNEGRGLVSQGTRDWTDYTVTAPIHIYVASAAGLGARVQGMRRYYALMLYSEGKARLVKALDGETTLAETSFPVETDHTYSLQLEVNGARLHGWIDGQQVFDVEDHEHPLDGGGIALICEAGRINARSVSVKSLGDRQIVGET